MKEKEAKMVEVLEDMLDVEHDMLELSLILTGDKEKPKAFWNKTSYNLTVAMVEIETSLDIIDHANVDEKKEKMKESAAKIDEALKVVNDGILNLRILLNRNRQTVVKAAKDNEIFKELFAISENLSDRLWRYYEMFKLYFEEYKSYLESEEH